MRKKEGPSNVNVPRQRSLRRRARRRSERQVLQNYRKSLVEGQATQFDAFDKHMLVLSGGAFGVSFAFIDKVVPGVWAFSGVLVAAWSCYAASILFTMTSFMVSQKAYERDISQLDCVRRDDRKPRRNWWTSAVGFLNLASLSSFVSGTIALIVFVFKNLAR